MAASRPILRVLNPHIYSDLAGLVQELVNLAEYFQLPEWDASVLLAALQEAILFPTRKSSSNKLANPVDIAGLLKPKKTVPRKVQKRNIQKDKGYFYFFFIN